jgi:hypothetical protein
MALYMHLGPFSRHVMAEIDRRIAELDEGAPPLAAQVAYRESVAASA